MKTSTHQANNNHFLMVEVPEGTTRVFTNNGHTLWHASGEQEYPKAYIQLPPGKWVEIGLASDLTEEQAAEIVEPKQYGEHDFYQHYLYPADDSCMVFAESSLLTLCKSKGMRPNTTVFLKRLN